VEDCGIHLQRNLRKRVKTGQREKQGNTAWDSMLNDMTDVSNLPSVTLVIICCHLFMVRWMALWQDTAVKYFSKFCFTFSWTRAQNGAGNGSDNNALEGINRVFKDAQNWVRYQLTQFGPYLLNWTKRQSQAPPFNSRFNETIWNNDMFNMVEEWKNQDYMDTGIEVHVKVHFVDRTETLNSFILPTASTVSDIASMSRSRVHEYEKRATSSHPSCRMTHLMCRRQCGCTARSA